MHFPAASPWRVCCGRARNVMQTCNENKANMYLTKGKKKKKKRKKDIVIPGNRWKKNFSLHEVCSWEGMRILPHSASASTCFCGRWGLFQCPHCDINHIPVPCDAGRFSFNGEYTGQYNSFSIGFSIEISTTVISKKGLQPQSFSTGSALCV